MIHQFVLDGFLDLGNAHAFIFPQEKSGLPQK